MDENFETENVAQLFVGGETEKGIEESKCMSVVPKKNNQGYCCDQCDRLFKSPKALFGHMRSHSRKKVEFVVKESFKIPNNCKKKKRSAPPMRFNFSNVDKDVLDVATCLLTLANGGRFHTNDDDKSLFLGPDLPMESTPESTNGDGVTEGVNECDLESGYLSLVEKMEEPNSPYGKSTIGYGLKKDGTEVPLGEDIGMVDDEKMNTAVVKSRGINTNKDKVYHCVVCFKAFTSGQALGGHKRAHFSTNFKSKPKDMSQHLALNVHVGSTTCLIPTHSSDLDFPQPVLKLEHLVPSL